MHSSFLQSQGWEYFQRSLGHFTWRVNDVLVYQNKLNNSLHYLYSPRASAEHVTRSFFDEIEKIAIARDSIFLKIDPQSKLDFLPKKAKLAKTLQPAQTTALNLENTLEEIKLAMHEKTRYNIRLAEKKGVSVVRNLGRDLKDDFEVFWKLLLETSGRDNFALHEKKYYEEMVSVRSNGFSNEIFFAKFEDKILAAHIVNFYQDTATYLHGASSRRYKEVMAPNLLHWNIIKEAKSRGFKWYDFWGIDEKKWPGITRFKLGFGGKTFVYPPAVDIPYRKGLYGLYRISKILRIK